VFDLVDESFWDVIVIGAGAAGLLAATRAAERGRRTLLLEKNRKPGVKILMSGGTRCNLTHDCDVAGIAAEFGRTGKFLRTALELFPPKELVAYVEAEGVATKVEEGGKVFPVSDRALDVQRALFERLLRSGCQTRFGQPVVSIDRDAAQFIVRTAEHASTARHLIVTTGGQSYPGCGTTGDGYRWLERLGHTIVPPRPALVPLLVHVPWVTSLSGLTMPHVGLRVVLRERWERLTDFASRWHHADRNALAKREGSLLFTHFGLSGPVALDVSRTLTGLPSFHDALLVLNLLPSQSYAETVTELSPSRGGRGGQTVARVLGDQLPQRIVSALMENLAIPRDQRCAELNRQTASRLAAAIHACELPVHGTRGFSKAEVTAGGVELREIHGATMASKKVPGLFVAGEVLDLDGPIGGYNFQAAFSTGWLAGSSV